MLFGLVKWEIGLLRWMVRGGRFDGFVEDGEEKTNLSVFMFARQI